MVVSSSMLLLLLLLPVLAQEAENKFHGSGRILEDFKDQHSLPELVHGKRNNSQQQSRWHNQNVQGDLCIDTKTECAEWAGKGWCAYDYISERCRVSCNSCAPGATPTCFDIGIHCDIIKHYGVCPQLKSICKRSCGVCGGHLGDGDEKTTTKKQEPSSTTVATRPPVDPMPPIDPRPPPIDQEGLNSANVDAQRLRFCCDTNYDVYNTSLCLNETRVTCDAPLEGIPFEICREEEKQIGDFFTADECNACVCYEGWRGDPFASCHQTKCPGSPSFKPHPECLTLTKDQGKLGCCIEHFCQNTTCKTDFGAYLGIGEDRVDPNDPCKRCSCVEGESESSPPITLCAVSSCLNDRGPECRPIKYKQDCCPKKWDCTNSYLIVTPKRWAAGEVVDICIFTPNGDNVNLTVALYDRVYGMEGHHLLLSDEDFSCINISIPNELPAGSYILSISGSIGNLSIEETRNIKVINIGKTWVQTDKYLYLPGQLVQFRILTVWGKHLNISYDEIPEVKITSPSGSRIAQWKNVNNDQGITHLDYTLSEEPEEGTYTIQVETKKSEAQQIFKVEPYVLPRFTVTITPPPYILATDMEANFTICAKYTFGEPVKGYLIYKAKPSFSFGRPLVPPILLEDGDSKGLPFNGCKEVTITPKDIGSKTTSFTLEATVEEEGTGVSAKGQINARVQSSQLKFTEISRDKYYKPGLPSTLQVLVSNPDDTPAADRELDICVMSNICSKLSTDADGILTAIIPSDVTMAKTQISVKITCDDCFNSTATAGFYYPRESSTFYYLEKFFSPSDSFMSLKSTLLGVDCELGREIALNVEYVAEADTKAQLWIVLISSGRIKSTSNRQVPFVTTPLTIDQSQVIGGDLGNVDSSHVRGETNMTVPLPTGASDIVKILVWYARADGEVVAASTSLKVPGCQRNPSTLSWSPSIPQEPGQLVNVILKAEPQSICSLGVVDKSVELLSRAQGGNQLTLEALSNLLQDLESPTWDRQTNDQLYCTGREGFLQPGFGVGIREKRSFVGFGSYTVERDTIAVFDDSGLYVLSDLTIETRPCVNNPYDIFTGFGGGGIDGPEIARPPAPEAAITDNNAASSPDAAKTSEDQDQLREYFPETWLWKILLVPANGSWQEELELPDTITEWVGEGICVHPEAGLGISNTASKVTFTSFFLDITIPATIKQGEAVPLKISVFNYLSQEIPVSVEVTGSGSYTILSGNGSDPLTSSASATSRLCIGPDSKQVTSQMIRSLDAGTVYLNVSAYIDTVNQESCGVNVTAGRRDTVIREIKVKWEGVEKQVIRSGYLCGGNSTQWQFTVPNNIVDGSARGFITVAADLMGPTIEHLDNLVRMPYGCGEQNMLGFTPNIFVMKYLVASGLETPEIVQELKLNMEAGYKRELQYRRNDGSYSAFGKRDDSGSTWLTAFVLKSFAQSRPYITVDEEELILSQKWLESLQKPDGCFELVGKVIHKDMKGGLGASDSDQLAPLTSYVIISLLEANLNTSDDTIDSAISCINSATLNTFYTEALRAYALALAGDDSTEDAIISATELLEIEEDNTSVSRSVFIEAMAYVLLAMLTYKPDDYEAEIAVMVRGITKYSNGEGGFVSTQDTVVALQALAEYSIKFPTSENSSLDVEVTKGGETWIFNVDKTNRLLVQMETVEVQSTEYNMTVTATGEGCALVSSILRYNVPFFGEIEAFSSVVEATAIDDCTSGIKACASYDLSDGESNMAIMEFDLTTGFVPIKETLDALLQEKIMRYEVDDNLVTLYFDSITAIETCIKFKARRISNVPDPKEATFTLYDYYDPQFTITKNFVNSIGSECS